MALAASPLEALEARSLLSQVFTVTNTSDNTSAGSLRWAIGQVNSDGTDSAASPDQIHFTIPQSDPGFGIVSPGAWTIAPATALPVINKPCIIDGYTQTGASAGTSAGAINADIKIDLNGFVGDISPNVPYGLDFGPSSGNSAGGVTSGVRGLAIHEFGTEVVMQGPGTFVQGCFLGLDPAGQSTGTSEVGTGVGIDSGSNGDLVGGVDPAERNLISSTSIGIQTGTGGATNGLSVEGNLIGTDLTGTALLPNAVGIVLGDGSNNSIGGTTPGARNVISGNVDYGINFLGDFASSDVVEGNYIGTDVTGTKGIENFTDGILFSSGTNNTVGGTSLGAANVISSNGLNTEGPSGGIVFAGEGGARDNVVEGNFIGTDATGIGALGNGGNGIRVQAGTGNAFLGNIIAFNRAIGIDLVGGTEDSFGVTANSPGGPHSGPNDLQNYPVLTSATVASGQTTIAGTLNSNPSSAFRVELYAVPTADPSGHGQALTFLGMVDADTDASGNAGFSLTVHRDLTGQFITALATIFTGTLPAAVHLAPGAVATPAETQFLQPGSTSEFSADIPATTSQLIGTTTQLASLLNPSKVGQAVTFVAAVTPNVPGPSPTGTVTFSVDGAAVATLPFTSEVAGGPSFVSYTTSTLAAGSHSVTAHYNPGSSSFLTSDSPVVQQAVNKTGTTTTLYGSPNPSTAGQPVLFSAVIAPVTPQDGPTGTVAFFVDGKLAATAPVGPLPDGGPDVGLATFLTFSLTPGNHTVVAQYSGDASFAPSQSQTVVETITPPVVNPAPRVVEVLRYGYHAAPTALAVVFDRPLFAATAAATDNYILIGPHRQVIPIVKASLAPGGEVVVLQPSRRLNVHWTYTLTIIGTPPYGVASSAGTFIGSDPVETITLHNLVWRRTLAGGSLAASRARPSAHAVDAVLAAEYRAHLAALGRRR